MRVDSPKPMKNGGHFHPFETARPRIPAPIQREKLVPAKDFGSILDRWRASTNGELAAFSGNTHLSEKSLSWLGFAWSHEHGAAAFPMFDVTSRTPCGIRLRWDTGEKKAVFGSKAGIFFPWDALNALPCRRIFVCEGPTDTAAALDLGLFAVGRASCRGGEDLILSVADQLSPAEMIVVSDNDGPGIEGADKLMEKLRCRKVKLTPPGKDMRQFLINGGTAEVLDCILKNLIRQ